jgi:hypothetical protein
MTTMSAEDAAKREREIEDVVAGTLRAMADMVVEDKRATLTELDRWVSMEEASHAKAVGQEH